MTQRGRTNADLIAENKIPFITLFLILVGLVIWFAYHNIPVKIGSLEVGSNSTKKDSIENKVNFNINATGNNNNNIIGDNNKIIEVKYSNPENQNHYSIEGTKNRVLINRITNLMKIKFVPNSKRYIKITHTGNILPLDKNTNTYYYTGGNVKIIINDNCYHEFENFKIDELRPNSISAINQEIDNSINHYIELNVQQFLNEIQKCVKS